MSIAKHESSLYFFRSYWRHKYKAHICIIIEYKGGVPKILYSVVDGNLLNCVDAVVDYFVNHFKRLLLPTEPLLIETHQNHPLSGEIRLMLENRNLTTYYDVADVGRTLYEYLERKGAIDIIGPRKPSAALGLKSGDEDVDWQF